MWPATRNGSRHGRGARVRYSRVTVLENDARPRLHPWQAPLVAPLRRPHDVSAPRPRLTNAMPHTTEPPIDALTEWLPLHLVGQLLADSADACVWLNPQGQPVWSNLAMAQLTGHELAACQAMPDFPASMVFEVDRDNFKAFRERARQQTDVSKLMLRVVCRDQSVKWLSVSWQCLYEEDGSLQGTLVILHGTELAVLTGSSPRDRLLSLRREALRITRDARAQAHDFSSLCAHITRQAGRLLATQRAGVWRFDDARQTLECISLHDLAKGPLPPAPPIQTRDYPRYIEAISSDELVLATDACHHPLTQELAATYLRPQGIGSLLDAPILQSGQTVGVLCFEHGPGLREWSAAEAAFADDLAMAIGLFLEDQAQHALQSLNARLASIIESTPDLVYTVTLDGEVRYLNHAGRALLGFGPEEDIAGHNAMSFVPPELKARRVHEIIPHTLKQGSWAGEVEMLTRDGTRIPAWEHFVAHRDDTGKVAYFSAVMQDLRQRKAHDAALKQREQALQTLNDELEARVRDRTRQIEEINRNLETFAFSVSHDLKAPLRGIDGYSRLLLEEHGPRLPTEAQHFIDNIRQATTSMSQLIDDLLAYSRVGRRELTHTRLSLRTAVQRVCREREHDLRAHHVTLHDETADIDIDVDLECLLQILRNLVDNAVKFSRQAAQPEIRLHTDVREGRVVLGVRDNGCGFDMKYHDRIFAIFQRLHRSSDYPGTGVGLAIVSKAAERLGGRVWAHSAPGQGAEFFLELPYDTSPHAH